MKIKLRWKISALFILLIAAIMIILSTIVIRDQRYVLKNEMIKAAKAVALNLAANAKEPLLLERYLDLDSLVYEAMKNEGVTFISITDKEGVIRAHNDVDKRNTMFKKPDNLVLNKEDGSLEYRDKNDHLNYYMTIDIIKSKKFLGRVHLGYSQEHIIKALDVVEKKMFMIAIGGIFFGIIGAILLSSYISRPIKFLVAGTHEIANENFDFRINVTSNDEIGDLTRSFNKMANELEHKELIKSAFKRYVSSQVLDKIIADPDFLKKLGGTRRELTILFSDIRGFTPLSEQLQPEEVITLLNDYLDNMTEIIFSNSGIIDKFIGDAIMAVWGALQADISPPEQAFLAVKSAIEMQNKLIELQNKWDSLGKKKIHVGIGINTGYVVVGNVGSTQRIEYTVIGDNVNIASRLESNAKPGQILIPKSTYDLIREKIVAVELEPLKVKGKSKLLQVYEVKRIRDKNIK